MSDNPLSKYFRKPSAFIHLPSRGIFNPEINQTMIGEIPILPMTTLDELELRNPDSLLNGEALISLIKSCVPSIPDPKKIPAIDAEALFLAIRYATYGSDTTHTHTCKNCGATSDYNIDINFILNKFPEITKKPIIEYEGLQIHIRPSTLESTTKVSYIEAEQLKLVEYYSSQEFQQNSVESSTKRIYDAFKRISTHNVDLIADAIYMIVDEDGNEFANREHIDEFLKNVPASLVEKIKAEVKSISDKPKDLSKMEFVCPDCNSKQEVIIEFNPVNFSVAG